MAKVVLVLLAALLAAIIAAKLLFNFTSYTGDEPVQRPWTQNKMDFVAWNGEEWTAWIRGDLFEQLPQDDKNWSRHSNGSIAFTAWDGGTWQAKIDGDEFILAHRGEWEGPVDRAEAIRYRDWAGRNQLRTVAQLRR